jgi:MFS family permease
LDGLGSGDDLHQQRDDGVVDPAWVGLFRNSPFPVLYALILDSVTDSASSGMGLTIGIALGLSGFVVSTVAGFFVQNYGFAWDYAMLVSACFLALIPITFLQETVPIAPGSTPT